MSRRLIQLLTDNRRAFVPMQAHIRAGADESTVYLYDAIVGDRLTAEWWGGVCPQDFVPALAALDVGTIHLRINSPGGDVFAAQAISQAIREHPANIVAHIDGVAASAATEIACACDSRVMAGGAMYMIHQAWTMEWGNADDLEATAVLLRKVDGTLADTYVARTGQERAQIVDWMKAETWFTADEAVAAGFVEAVAEPPPKSTTAQGAWNLRAYGKAPTTLQSSARLPQIPGYADSDHRARINQRLRIARVLQPVE